MLWLHCPKRMGTGSEREAPPETRNRERRAAATPQRRDGNGRQPSLTRPRMKPDRNAGRVFPCPAGGRIPGIFHSRDTARASVADTQRYKDASFGVRLAAA